MATLARTRRAARVADVRGLEQALRSELAGEVRFGAGDRALYSATGANYRHVPIGVVVPRSVDDVVATVALCREHGAPIVPGGGGTGLAGQTTNIAVVIDCSKYLNRILEIDAQRKLARVQPGVVLDRLREAAQQRGLTFGPDPSTHAYCTLGGMIGANSCGVHSVHSAVHGPGPRTSDNVHELTVLTYGGRRLRLGPDGAGLPDDLDEHLPERGFNAARALSGTEGTCVTVLEATVHLVDSPPCRSLLVAGYEDAATAADHVLEVLEHEPLGLEGVDDTLIRDMTLLGQHREDLSLLPDGRGWLLIETGGETKAESDDRARGIMRTLDRAGGGLRGLKLYDDARSEQHVWEEREAGLGATAFVPGRADTCEGWEDSAVPPGRLGDYLRELGRLATRYGYESALYGHYGQGCVHARWNFDLVTKHGIETWRGFLGVHGPSGPPDRRPENAAAALDGSGSDTLRRAAAAAGAAGAAAGAAALALHRLRR
jgi:FAD/FMN-containing dehydrogenase